MERASPGFLKFFNDQASYNFHNSTYYGLVSSLSRERQLRGAIRRNNGCNAFCSPISE